MNPEGCNHAEDQKDIENHEHSPEVHAFDISILAKLLAHKQNETGHNCTGKGDRELNKKTQRL